MKNVSEIADIVEVQTWAADRVYSLGALKEDLEAALPEPEHEQAEELAQQVFDQLAERARILAAGYPFIVDGTTIRPGERCRTNSAYLFCLGLEFLGNITAELRTKEFETIVKAAAERYFRGNGIRIGAPWATADITSYKLLLEKVSDLIPGIGPPVRDQAPQGGDGGWDIVVVNGFADQKFSRVIALGNCATGRTNWLQKGLETQPTFFWDFFSRPPQSRDVCLTFFAVPFSMTDEDRRRKAGRDCITFDRVRICEHEPSASDAVMEWLNANKAVALDLPLL